MEILNWSQTSFTLGFSNSELSFVFNDMQITTDAATKNERNNSNMFNRPVTKISQTEWWDKLVPMIFSSDAD